jgi:hypothetical protein
MGQFGPSVTFSATHTAKQCYSAAFITSLQNFKTCFLRYIDTGNLVLENGILAAGTNGLAADDAGWGNER